MSIPYGGDTYPHYQGKYGLGDNIRNEYLEALSKGISKVSTNNRDELDLRDNMEEELLLARCDEKPEIDMFVERLDVLLELFNGSRITGEFLIDLGFTFEDFGRMQVNGIDKRRTIEIDGEQKRINGDEQSFGTIVKSRIIGKVKFPSKQYTK